MRLSAQGRAKLQRLEGFRGVAYIPVPGDKPTIGYGFTSDVKLGDMMSREVADVRLIGELIEYERAVFDACEVRPNQNQFDAMVLFCFNVGVGGFLKSTVLRAHNDGDFQSAARAFGLWDKSGGKVYAGLTKRRAEESALYLTPMPDDMSDPVVPSMPQTIDGESKMTASPINRASVIAGMSAGIAGVTEAAKAVGDMKISVGALGDWLLPVVLLCVVGLCAFVVYQRVAQRRYGWA